MQLPLVVVCTVEGLEVLGPAAEDGYLVSEELLAI